MSWTQWIPSMPSMPSVNFALPASIQRRFIAFAVKSSLGHLLKPGQLDTHQIDSQIGAGYVRIRDLEVDNTAINALLVGLPLELHDGSISCVTARIPWPNPLTSTLGCSIESLHLTFHLNPTKRPDTSHVNLSESVISVADSFIHHELTPVEEVTLRESVHSAHQAVPGGMDPFLSGEEEEEYDAESDPAGVSLFASLVERMLARFEFDAVDTRITIVHPGGASFTFSIAELRYGTEAASSDSSIGQTRTVTISGVNVTARNLRPIETAPPSPLTPSPLTPVSPKVNRNPAASGSSAPNLPHIDTTAPIPSAHDAPSSPASSSSSMDEEAEFNMSQSLAFLPRPASPAESTSSSMYESAASFKSAASSRSSTPSPHREASPSRTPSPNKPELQREIRWDTGDEQILSFGTEPIVVRLTTPSAVPVALSSADSATAAAQRKPKADFLSLEVTMGTIAVALRSWHLRSLIAVSDSWGSHHLPPSSPSLDASPPSPGPGIQGGVTTRGLVLLALPNAGFGSRSDALSGFFASPNVPPRLSHGYTRLQVEQISLECSMAFSMSTNISTVKSKSQKPSTIPIAKLTTQADLAVSVTEISLYAFHLPPTNSLAVQTPTSTLHLVASPILITDQHLASQYTPRHTHPDPSTSSLLPSFEVADWTRLPLQSSSTKLSIWRTKFKSPKQTETTLSPVLSVTAKRTVVSPSSGDMGLTSLDLKVDIVPLHIMCDLELLLGGDLVSFVAQVLAPETSGRPRQPSGDTVRSESDTSSSEDAEDSDEGTPPATPRGPSARQKEKQRQTFEQSVMEDLGLEIDYRGPAAALPPRRPTKSSRKKVVENVVNMVVNLEMVRIQVRCPPPPRRNPRSGALVVDLHDISLSNTVKASPTRFSQFSSDEEAPISGRSTLLAAEVSRILVASSFPGSSKAFAVASIGSINDPLEQKRSPLKARLVVSKTTPLDSPRSSDSPRPSTTVLAIDIPSVHAELSKPSLDGLQYWADDVTQLIERTFNVEENTSGKTLSRDPSLIGSRFFAKSRGTGNDSGNTSVISGSRLEVASETVVKLAVSEAFIRLDLPRGEVGFTSKPFDLRASDVDVLMELKPEGKDETVITVGIMDLNIQDSVASVPFLCLTSQRGMFSSSKSLVKLRFTSLVVPTTTAKESRVKLTLCGFTYNILPDFAWAADLGRFAKAPPGAFESVIPSERTKISLKVVDASIRALAPTHPGALLLYIDEMDFATDIVGDSPESSFRTAVTASVLLTDRADAETRQRTEKGSAAWKKSGYALLAELDNLELRFISNSKPPDSRVYVDRVGLNLHLCADTATVLGAFGGDLASAFKPPAEEAPPKPKRGPTLLSKAPAKRSLLESLDESAFKRVPDVGSAPDLIMDDLPKNLDYLDEAFGAAAGLRELRDDDLDEFDLEDVEVDPSTLDPNKPSVGVISNVGGETIKILTPKGVNPVENHFLNLPPDATNPASEHGQTALSVRVRSCDVQVKLYDGYDWEQTRKTIENEVKEMRRRLAKIRQLVASGQTQDPSVEDTSALLFNSVYIGLEQDPDELDPGALIAAIDNELNEDLETASQSSWQSLKPATAGNPHTKSTRVHGKRLTRSKGPSIEFCLKGVHAEVDQYQPGESLLSRIFATVTDLEILDHIKTSTWKKFLTSLRTDSRGNVRETESNMVRVELRTLRPDPGHPSEEARLRAKILPLRLHVDQDALDFLKRFFSFQDPNAVPSTPKESSAEDIFFQLAEIFPVDLKLDYKPRRVDYRALKEGKTIELMNFFHFDGAEMTLRHITLTGITGWPRMFDMLNDLWTPDVKATQLMEVISGVAPIRSVVNVGSGVADLILLPIAQYKKDGRIVRGFQKGTTAFMKSTAMEAIKLGAHLATGTQVILEQAEGILGGQLADSITAETLQIISDGENYFEQDNEGGLTDEEGDDVISKYAEQPTGVKEGVQTAYRSLQKNFNSAAQTILAVPMEVYERSGNEGPVRAVIRAVPIAVLKPMIGASEAVSKTLLGLQNTLDPNIRHENDAKYKHR